MSTAFKWIPTILLTLGAFLFYAECRSRLMAREVMIGYVLLIFGLLVSSIVRTPKANLQTSLQ